MRAVQGGLPVLIFHVEVTLVAVSAKVDARKPVRRLAHKPAYFADGYLRSGLDNHFVMHVTNDLVSGEPPHSRQKNSADGLHDVFSKFWIIAFNAAPSANFDNEFVYH